MFNMHRSFHGPMRGRPFGKGDLKYVILDLIKDKPRHGYDIIRALQEHSHGFYTPSPGVVYPTLQLLEEMGYAIADQQDSKRVYSITEEGLKFLAEREKYADDIKSHMAHCWNIENIDEVGETMHRFGELGKILWMKSSRASADKLKQIQEIITKAHGDIEGILKD